MTQNLVQQSVHELFTNHEYVIPIYQRNYAWGQAEIEMLLNDISYFEVNDNSDHYFLGTIIVNKRKDGKLEVIDGQQRLTTLFILLTYLEVLINLPLEFEARKRSNQTLLNLKNITALNRGIYTEEIVQGYSTIENYLNTFSDEQTKQFIIKLQSVKILQVQVPPDTDLNHYFEIMNNRGEQLELHEVAKGKLLSQFSHSEEEKSLAALIWDACSNMNNYIQMNFDVKLRDLLFGSTWTTFAYNNFDELLSAYEQFGAKPQSKQRSSLLEILQSQQSPSQIIQEEPVKESTRFESIMSFPNFLLQVNAVSLQEDDEKEEQMLNDQHLLKNLDRNFKNTTSAKKFIYQLLYARVLFDTYIIKREYLPTYSDDGKWSLQKLHTKPEKAKIPRYKATFTIEQDQLRKLQSCLRVTFTSPRTMKWIHYTLKHLITTLSMQKDRLKLTKQQTGDLIFQLEHFCIERLEKIDFLHTNGFDIPRIAFTYLDYVLYRDQSHVTIQSDWDFQFRNSIEHFFPQNPDQSQFNSWDKKDLDHFGNLALITVHDNSKFSNLPPKGKIESYRNVIDQSPKLKLMATVKSEWTNRIAREHGEEMIEILVSEVKRIKQQTMMQ
ncbi:hypothetical protein DH09_13910 [Bacillaceae bacterium JMAK1]|nr:hypothetical protein DH09_13910 [Bacillaceae bacterium JMAK1]